jgi:monoamine oxidase
LHSADFVRSADKYLRFLLARRNMILDQDREIPMKLTRRAFGLAAAAFTLAGAKTMAAKPVAKTPMLDTIILGAGISGLNAALLLEQEGQKVLLLEARQRVGGRIHTLFDQPGYPEMGFNTMGSGYGRGIDAAQRAGVELVDLTPRLRQMPPSALFVRSQHIPRDQWPTSPLNPFPAELKSMLPGEIASRLVSKNNPLADWTQWASPDSGALDIPLQQYLKQYGLSDAAIRFAYDSAPAYGSSAWEVSALMLEFIDGFIKGQIAAGPQQFGVKGGNGKLILGLQKLLKGDLLMGKRVVAISSEADAATVHCADGSSCRAARVICSLPLATLRRIRFDPGLSGAQAQAVASIPYQPFANAFLTVQRPFWQDDGISPNMWTDGPLGTVFPQYFGASDSEVTGLLVQGRGELAKSWDRMGPQKALATIVETLETLRPAAKGAVTAAHYHSWGAEEFSTGAWAYFQPGQIRDLHASIAQPAGRVHFCGEHTATGARGVEGALESSERVVLEVLTA